VLDAIGSGALVALPGVLTIYLAFNTGGYFEASRAVVVAVLGVVLMLRIALVERPLAGFSRSLLVVAVALSLLAGWVLLSGVWSDAPARAASELDRVLLYLFALLLFGSALRKPGALRRSVRVLAASIGVVAIAALATRLFPDEFASNLGLAPDRLSFPLTYWNAVGVLMAIGIVLCLHLTSDERESRLVRVFSAGLLPVMGTALLLTFSRGSIVVVLGGIVAYALLARPRGLPAAVLAAGPTTAIAMKSAYAAELLASKTESQTAAAAAQGHDVALTLALCCLAAIALRAMLLPLDAYLARLRLPGTPKRGILLGTVVGVLLATIAVGVAVDMPGEIGRQYDRAFDQGEVAPTDTRSRLNDTRLGREDHWEVALDAFRAEPLRGEGAGTFELVWARDRPDNGDVTEAHSLYLETLAELGVVGGVLLAVALLTILSGFLSGARGPNRALYAALAAAALVWMVHAGIDWDWEMPAVTLWLFAMGGAALACRRPTGIAGTRPHIAVRAAIGVLCLVAVFVAARAVTGDRAVTNSLSAFHSGDCAAAIPAAREAIDFAGARPEPYEVRGWCAIHGGRPAPAVRAMRSAVERDPHNWRLRYGLGIAQASAGIDPRPQLRLAHELNPHGSEPSAAVAAFRSDDPRVWRRRAHRAPLPFG
jgi:O-antigen ligase